MNQDRYDFAKNIGLPAASEKTTESFPTPALLDGDSHFRQTAKSEERLDRHTILDNLQEIVFMKIAKKKTAKSLLVEEVMAKGFTSRKATKAVNAVFDRMKFALQCGDEVPIPGGTVQAQIRNGKPRRKFQRFQNVNTGKRAYKLIKYPGRHRVVKFTPDESLDLTPLPVPPPPETPEQIEARQLATELLALKRPADNALMAKLQQAFEVHPTYHGSVLLRLREIKARGWQSLDVHSLAAHVAALYWL
jgi:nucleoid DNA-binding protein